MTLVASSPAMQQVNKQIAIASQSDLSVLIQGPRRIGKETVAAAIHRNSQRHLAPFLAFNIMFSAIRIAVPRHIERQAMTTSSLEDAKASHRKPCLANENRLRTPADGQLRVE